jgi:hypothetical protein
MGSPERGTKRSDSFLMQTPGLTARPFLALGAGGPPPGPNFTPSPPLHGVERGTGVAAGGVPCMAGTPRGALPEKGPGERGAMPHRRPGGCDKPIEAGQEPGGLSGPDASSENNGG